MHINQLTLDQLQDLHDGAVEAAKIAGQFIANAASQPVDVLHKDAGDSLASQVVTEVDRQCDTLIRQYLAPYAKRYDLAFLTEEQEDDGLRLQKNYFWSVDPLDGTLAFIRSQPGYAVSIGLVARDGTPMIGVIYEPLTQVVYSAIKTKGAFINGQSWSYVNQSTVFTHPVDDGAEDKRDFVSLRRLLDVWLDEQGYRERCVRHHAGSVMSAIWVAEAGQGCYFKLPKATQGGGCSWDFAATACVFTELGFQVYDFAAKPLALNREGDTYMNVTGVIYATDSAIGDYLLSSYKTVAGKA